MIICQHVVLVQLLRVIPASDTVSDMIYVAVRSRGRCIACANAHICDLTQVGGRLEKI